MNLDETKLVIGASGEGPTTEEQLDKLRINTVMVRARPMVTNIVTNLFKTVQYSGLHNLPTNLLAGRPAFVVAAGPSLDRNGPFLREAATKGPIIACNTALGALKRMEVPVDFAVSVESMDNASFIKPNLDIVNTLVTVLTSHPAVWDLPGVNHLWATSATPNEGRLSMWLDAPPLQYGSSVATACAGLAYHLGAGPVVLVGLDLSFPEGRGYAKGATWDGYDATFETKDGQEIMRFHGREDRDAHHKTENKRSLPPTQVLHWRPGWGGVGRVAATADFLNQAQWFEAQNRAMGGKLYINATEGGTALEDVEEARLKSLLDRFEGGYTRWQDLVTQIPTPAGLPHLRLTLKQLHLECERVNRMAECYSVCDGKSLTDLEALWHGFPLVEFLSFGRVLELKEAGYDRRKMLVYAYEAIREAAVQVEGMLQHGEKGLAALDK